MDCETKQSITGSEPVTCQYTNGTVPRRNATPRKTHSQVPFTVTSLFALSSSEAAAEKYGHKRGSKRNMRWTFL